MSCMLLFTPRFGVHSSGHYSDECSTITPALTTMRCSIEGTTSIPPISRLSTCEVLVRVVKTLR
jgi:hypothetical protein